jgi:uncharacterized membrane protein
MEWDRLNNIKDQAPSEKSGSFKQLGYFFTRSEIRKKIGALILCAWWLAVLSNEDVRNYLHEKIWNNNANPTLETK